MSNPVNFRDEQIFEAVFYGQILLKNAVKDCHFM